MLHPVSSFFGQQEDTCLVFLGDTEPSGNLPSGESARAFIKGEPGGALSVVGHTVLRSGLIMTGMAVAGVRGPDLWKGALGGSVAIETFVLGWTYLKTKVKT